MPRSTRPSLVFVLGLAPVKIGGLEKFLRLFVLAMDRRGWDTVLCFDGAVSDEFRSTVSFPFCHIESVDGQGDLGFPAAGSLWRVLRTYRPKRFLYAFHGVLRCFPWLARLAGCSGIAFYDHSSRAPEFVAAPLALPKRIVGRLLTLPLNQVIAVSAFTRRTGQALGLTACPSTVLPNGVFLPEPSAERGAAFRARYGIPADAVVVAQLCWMVPVKGVEILLRAAVPVLQALPKAFFLLVGDGPQRADYQALAASLGIADRVLFTGVISDPTAHGVLEAADLYCQPSLWQEASGLALMEAMSFAVPPVVSRTGGMPELVHEGQNGALFAPGDSAELAGKLLQLAGDAALRNTLGANARATIASHHRIEDTAEGCARLVIEGPAATAGGPLHPHSR